MRRRGARIVVDPLLGLKNLDRKTLARQRQRRDDADRAAAGNENGTLGRHVPAFYAGRSAAAIRGGGGRRSDNIKATKSLRRSIGRRGTFAANAKGAIILFRRIAAGLTISIRQWMRPWDDWISSAISTAAK
jgi:hypothetical protein